MAFGDYYTYPWATTSAATTVQFQYSGSTSQPVYSNYQPPPPVEMPEGPMEWLRRRVTEITDLAYAA